MPLLVPIKVFIPGRTQHLITDLLLHIHLHNFDKKYDMFNNSNSTNKKKTEKHRTTPTHIYAYFKLGHKIQNYIFFIVNLVPW